MRPRTSLHDDPMASLISGRIDHGFSLNINTPMQFAFGTGNEPRIATVVSPCRKIDNSLAVVKDSKDPYADFKSSMLQMVFEKGIEAESDLEELLKCFLKMNSPANHAVIARAFVEIWDGVSHNKPTSSSFNCDCY
ncbi:hypothetical protein MLD38_011719 [Melastoma candidum]|uniref:Uncharacterized protein n=1 Tax=Melastoma candidum TaxID=119954 RepID=A0ACB9R6Z5_9MYRT|nr:hypothetical protein MLD38_011719 [Melastoma candidum]